MFTCNEDTDFFSVHNVGISVLPSDLRMKVNSKLARVGRCSSVPVSLLLLDEL